MSTTNHGPSDQPLTRKQLRELEATRQAAGATAPSPAPQPVSQPPAPPVSVEPRRSSPPVFSTPPTSTPSTSPTPPQVVAPKASVPNGHTNGGPTRVSAASRLAGGTGPTSEQARRAPKSAEVPSNLKFAPDVFSAQNGLAADTNVTRRSIHQMAGTTADAPGAPVVPDVVPPSQTSSIRRIDETGEMTTVTATGQAVAPEVANITRKSIWASRTDDSGVGQPVSTEIPIAPTADPNVVGGFSQISDQERAEAAAQDTATMMAIAADIPAPRAPEQTSGLLPSLNSELGQAQPVAIPGMEGPTVQGNLPDWSAITAPDSSLPTDFLPDPGPALSGVGFTPVPANLAEADVITDEEEPVVELDHSYTWLHLLIIVAIAAVLGMLVWKLALDPKTENKPDPDQQSMGYAVVQTLS